MIRHLNHGEKSSQRENLIGSACKPGSWTKPFEGLIFGATKNTEGVGLFDAYLVEWLEKIQSGPGSLKFSSLLVNEVISKATDS